MPVESDWVQVAVGIVRDRQSRILMTSRPASKVYAGWWEFPGGKLESGETVEQALVRELAEELGLQTDVAHITKLWSQQYVYAHARVMLHFCLVEIPRSALPSTCLVQLEMREGQQACWLEFSGIDTRPAVPYPVLPASQPVIEQLQVTQGHLEGQVAVDR
jgi:8-oxo-dGTP diphosphatase